MKVQALWNGKIIAEADAEDTLMIEGNYYFPPEALYKEHFKTSGVHTTCFWKGEASYYDVIVNGQTNASAAWFYPVPKPGSREVVAEQNQGKNSGNFANYVAFWNGVEVREVA